MCLCREFHGIFPGAGDVTNGTGSNQITKFGPFYSPKFGIFWNWQVSEQIVCVFLLKRHFKAISDMVAIHTISSNFLLLWILITRFLCENQIFSIIKYNVSQYFDIYLRFTSFKNKSNVDIKQIFVCFCLFEYNLIWFAKFGGKSIWPKLWLCIQRKRKIKIKQTIGYDWIKLNWKTSFTYPYGIFNGYCHYRSHCRWDDDTHIKNLSSYSGCCAFRVSVAWTALMLGKKSINTFNKYALHTCVY